MDKDASRNRAPLFLCGSLTKDESTVTINMPTTSTPLPLKKSMSKGGDTPIALRDVLSVSNQAKRSTHKTEENHPASNDQALGKTRQICLPTYCSSQSSLNIDLITNRLAALCYGDDPEAESEPEETLASLKRKNPSNSGSSSKKKAEENLELVAVDDEQRSTHGKENEKSSKKIEHLPSKDVAIHRVRWNMNKGSERWLSYGGAAGIVRCQEIVLSDIDKKWALKK